MRSLKNLPLLILLLLSIPMACSSEDDTVTTDDAQLTDDDPAVADCSNTSSIFTIDLDPSGCTVDIQNSLGVTSQYEETVSGTTRTITINGIANHNVGTFPNAGNPNTIGTATETFTMTTEPALASQVTFGQGYTFGVLFSGVAVDPYTAEFFQGTGGTNMAWNITTLQSDQDLGLDCNNAHVQPTGRYHYHGTPSRYIDDLDTADGTQMIKGGICCRWISDLLQIWLCR